jgi:hypothetical protein
LHPPGYIQEGQEASYDYLLLGVYHRNSPGATIKNFLMSGIRFTHLILSIFFCCRFRIGSKRTAAMRIRIRNADGP